MGSITEGLMEDWLGLNGKDSVTCACYLTLKASARLQKWQFQTYKSETDSKKEDPHILSLINVGSELCK